MISFLSFILWRPGKVEDNDRKPYTSASVYSSRFDWWPTIENCIVHLLTSHSLTKYHWQFDHHHTYPGGSSPQDPIVFFLPEFFSLRSLLKSKRVPEKTSISALLTMPKPLTVWITRNCGQFFKRWANIRMFNVVPEVSWAAISFHSFFCILFCNSDFHHSVLQVIYPCFCLSYSAMDFF